MPETCEDGNRRFVRGCPWGSATKDAARQQLVDEGQAPHTAIIGCADSRAPLETIFDAMPGRSKEVVQVRKQTRNGLTDILGCWEHL